jgi:hypothetical protein
MKRLLILRLSALGDVIHTIPAVVALRAAMPTRYLVDRRRSVRGAVGVVARVRAVPVRLKRWSRKPFSSAATCAVRCARSEAATSASISRGS